MFASLEIIDFKEFFVICSTYTTCTHSFKDKFYDYDSDGISALISLISSTQA